MSKKFLPFWMYPTWHLTKNERARAKVLHDYDEGSARDRALLPLDYEYGSQEYALRKLDLDHQEGIISDYEHEIQNAVILYKDDKQDLEIVDIDLKYGKLTEQQAAKKSATIKKEAWVGGPMNYDGEGGVLFDLDWNEYWIEELKQNGYTGDTDDQIMKKWFAALCYSEVIENNGEELDPFFYETARQTLNKLMNKDS